MSDAHTNNGAAEQHVAPLGAGDAAITDADVAPAIQDATQAAGAKADNADANEPKSAAKKLNVVLVAIAFVILFGYLFVAGEAEDTLRAISQFNWWYLLLALVFMIAYWLLESACMQLIVERLYGGFSFVKTVIVTIIGQYFNCITPLSSGGQPMQAYYYSRFGLPLSDAMTMLLCRFIIYQLTMTVYAVIVLILRFNYFTEQLRGLMYLVAIGFVGGLFLLAMLLALAFAKNTVIKAVTWFIDIGGRLGIVKDPEKTLTDATSQLEGSYVSIRILLKDPALICKVAAVTFVQLTVYFSISYIIYLGFGEHTSDYFSVMSCQAFIYLIASFVPLPGALGAAEISYVAFFQYIYGNPSLAALSTFVWRMFTFYLPIMVGMILTIVVNNPHTWLAKWIERDNARAAHSDHAPQPTLWQRWRADRAEAKAAAAAAQAEAAEQDGAAQAEAVEAEGGQSTAAQDPEQVAAAEAAEAGEGQAAGADGREPEPRRNLKLAEIAEITPSHE